MTGTDTPARAKLLYSATMSLDGFIAGPGGDQSWMTRYLGPNPLADELINDIGALLVGAHTIGGDDPNRGTDKEGAFSSSLGSSERCSTDTNKASAQTAPDGGVVDR